MQAELINIEDDIAELRKIAQKAFKDSSDAKLEEWFSFAEMSKAIKEGRGVCVKVNLESKPVGFIYAQQESPINGREGLEKWVIVMTAVDPIFSGKGVGVLLLKEIEKQAASKGARKVFVYTNKNDDDVVRFYKKNGYADAGWIKDYQYGEDNSAVFLIKYLS